MFKEDILQSIDSSKMNCAFVIKDLKTGVSTAYHEDEIVPAASLIKIPIMAEVIRQVKVGKLSFQQRILIREVDKVPFSILTMLETGNSYSLKDLITLMIIQSDNTAANMLIDLAGLSEINAFIQEIGLKNTVLQRKMLDSEARKAGKENLTTASDMAWLMESLYRRTVIGPDQSAEMIRILKNQLDKSMMRLDIPDETVIAHKTGELEGLAHEAGIVYHANGDYILVAFIWNAVNNLEARQGIGRIAKLVYDYFIRSNYENH